MIIQFEKSTTCFQIKLADNLMGTKQSDNSLLSTKYTCCIQADKRKKGMPANHSLNRKYLHLVIKLWFDVKLCQWKDSNNRKGLEYSTRKKTIYYTAGFKQRGNPIVAIASLQYVVSISEKYGNIASNATATAPHTALFSGNTEPIPAQEKTYGIDIHINLLWKHFALWLLGKCFQVYMWS